VISDALVIAAKLAGFLSRRSRSLAAVLERVGSCSGAATLHVIKTAVGPQGRRGHHASALPLLLLALVPLTLAICAFAVMSVLRICAALLAPGDRPGIGEDPRARRGPRGARGRFTELRLETVLGEVSFQRSER